MTKKLLLLTTLFLAFACSKENETFLDIYNGTSWAINSEIITFSNGEYFYNVYSSEDLELNEAHFDGVDTSDFESFNCIQYKEGINTFNGVDYDIFIEVNEANQLAITSRYDQQIIGMSVFVPDGEDLILTESRFFGEESETTKHRLTKSDQSYSDFCN